MAKAESVRARNARLLREAQEEVDGIAPEGTESLKWTGENLSEVKKFHRNLTSNPVPRGAEDYARDATQQPDVLHLTTREGHTLLVRPGDMITKDAAGRITVVPATKKGK